MNKYHQNKDCTSAKRVHRNQNARNVWLLRLQTTANSATTKINKHIKASSQVDTGLNVDNQVIVVTGDNKLSLLYTDYICI